MDAPQVIVVGSGPAGVSAAFPLVERGIRVLMLDAGEDAPAAPEIDPKQSLRQVRHRADQWKLIVGDSYRRPSPEISTPKLGLPIHRHIIAGHNERYGIVAKNFVAVGSLAKGGLSGAWGAGVAMFDDNDLASFPISLADLLPSYRRVSKRIGIAGSNDDDLAEFHGIDDSLLSPVRPSGNIATLYERYSANPHFAKAQGLTMGHARNAVLTEKLGDRQGCIYCGRCLWGCAQGAIYSAADDLDELQRRATFSLRSGHFVERIIQHEDGWRVVTRNEHTAANAHFDARRVILACGAMGSAKLVLSALEQHHKDVAFQTTPRFFFALILARGKPRRLTDEEVFGLAQISFRADLRTPQPDYASGQFFPADTLPASEYISLLPFAYPLARRIVRLGQPQLILGNGYFASRFSRNTLRLGTDGCLEIKGSYDAEVTSACKMLERQLRRSLKRYRALLAPGAFRLSPPGDDIHYAGTIPMRESPKANETHANGEVAGLPGVYVADGGTFPSLPPKLPTLTVMANADRIGTLIAERSLNAPRS